MDDKALITTKCIEVNSANNHVSKIGNKIIENTTETVIFDYEMLGLGHKEPQLNDEYINGMVNYKDGHTLSGFDYVVIHFIYHTSGTSLLHNLFSEEIKLLDDSDISYMTSESQTETDSSTTQLMLYNRRLILRNSKLEIGYGYATLLNTTTARDNKCFLPYKIIGYKYSN